MKKKLKFKGIKKISVFVFFLPILLNMAIMAQPFAFIKDKTLTLDNGVIRRKIEFEKDGGVNSMNLILLKHNTEFLNQWQDSEFSFLLNEKYYSSKDAWKFVSCEIIKGEYQGEGAEVVVERNDIGVRLKITYLLYPELPIIRKKIEFINTGKKEIKLEAVDVEKFIISEAYTGQDSWIMRNYARQKTLETYIGDKFDPVIVLHQVNKSRGIVLGNETPGVLKRTTAFLKQGLVSIGLTYPDQPFAFRKWIQSGDSWVSPWVFSGLYDHCDDPYVPINTQVNDFVRKHLGVRININPNKPGLVYNTWIPFQHQINEKLIYELIDAAADCGAEKFVIDDGWTKKYGDWEVDSVKFPNGLKPIFDYIKSKGMKPGIWISIAAAQPESKVYQNHPEWLARRADGSPFNLQSDQDRMYQSTINIEAHTMCMTTGWKDHIKNIILRMVKEYGLEYVKADYATVTGAYTLNKSRSGCHAPGHLHHDRNESLLELYRSTWQLFDEIHSEVPELFIDCTYETMGGLQLIDLDMCKHAEGNWLSNFHEKAPLGAFRVRQMAWWRSPVIPAGAMVIGNQVLDDPQFELSLKSLAGTFPIALGDPRKLTKDQRMRIKSWATWLRSIQKKYNYMIYRQDLPGFAEPQEGCWDGFQRINTDNKSGGIVGVFRQNAADEERYVRIQMLVPDAIYEIFIAPEGKKIISLTGKELSEKGFKVRLKNACDGNVYEIRKK
jgi:alpha-galactosidase